MKNFVRRSVVVLGNPDDTDLFNERRLRVVRLEFFGIHVFPVCQHDHVFAAAGDRESASGVDKAEIPRMQPAVEYRFGGLIRRTVVSLHQHWTPDPNFTDPFVIGRIDSDRYAPKWYPNGSDMIVADWRDRCRSGRFG